MSFSAAPKGLNLTVDRDFNCKLNWTEQGFRHLKSLDMIPCSLGHGKRCSWKKPNCILKFGGLWFFFLFVLLMNINEQNVHYTQPLVWAICSLHARGTHSQVRGDLLIERWCSVHRHCTKLQAMSLVIHSHSSCHCVSVSTNDTGRPAIEVRHQV